LDANSGVVGVIGSGPGYPVRATRRVPGSGDLADLLRDQDPGGDGVGFRGSLYVVPALGLRPLMSDHPELLLAGEVKRVYVTEIQIDCSLDLLRVARIVPNRLVLIPANLVCSPTGVPVGLTRALDRPPSASAGIPLDFSTYCVGKGRSCYAPGDFV
jgi:hypothetical protein